MSDLNKNNMHIASDMHMKNETPQLCENQDSGSRKGVPAYREIMRDILIESPPGATAHCVFSKHQVLI